MCGIIGLIGEIQNPMDLMEIMLTQQEHRGPDARGVWHDDDCILGHNRLSVIDLNQSANQPFSCKDGRYILVFNGEIYNFKSIKKELNDVKWKTKSDTEVLLQAYLKWGKDCLQKLNGMFAFVIWDKCEKSLFIARDRLGIKPLYYSMQSEKFLFASEVRTLLKSGLVSKQINKSAILDFIKYQWIQTPSTIISSISSLPAGHYAVYKENKLEVIKWWDINNYSEKYQEIDLDLAHRNIKHKFNDAVEKRLVSDVPIGAFLSGGIDSSAIVAAMASISSEQINTFSIGFKEKKYDESEYAALIAKRFNTKHHMLQYSASKMKGEVPSILESFDTPSSDGINSYIVSKLVKEEGITVALSGLGGDELFGGYPFFKQIPKLQHIPFYWDLPLMIRKGLSAPLSKFFGSKKFRMQSILRSDSNSIQHLYPFFREINNEKNLNRWLNQDKLFSEVEEVYKNIDTEKTLTWISIAEICGYTQHVLLKDSDMCSMANALEVRVPFFDHKLIEFVLGLPDVFKRSISPKKLLTDALSSELPEEIINRPKMGFAFPWKYWLKNDLHSFVEHYLNKSKNYDFLNFREIEHSWHQFLKGNETIRWYQIWNLTCLLHWLDTNLD